MEVENPTGRPNLLNGCDRDSVIGVVWSELLDRARAADTHARDGITFN